MEEEGMISKKTLKTALLVMVLLLLALAGGCKKKVAAPPPPPPPPATPPAAPTVTLNASPTTIEKGQCATLTWSSTNATTVSLDQGIGDVATSGSRQVCPSESTTYTINVKGEGGTASATTRITVNSPAPPPPPPPPSSGPTVEELFSQSVGDIYFDYDKSDIREDAKSSLNSSAEFLKQNSSVKFNVEGHCDERGSEEYNLGLGDRRANSAKTYLVNLGIAADRMNTVSYGKEKPVCTEKSEGCWQKNRRAHFVFTSR
jgi:peptidoglycan-associated lipoprotein